ncbi:MAG: FAD-dependent oxidoreductase [Lachnospiraceae bacterium]|nr:FAD-dependent oxidoreductase [Lachnospiraceae bacterium]
MKDYHCFYDLIVVGAGPAGLASAIYMARAKYKVLVLEKEKIGGQITITSEVVNYPGVELASGKSLTESMRKQAESFGTEFAIATVQEMQLEEKIKIIKTDKGDYETLGVILAVGANPRKVGFQGEKEFQGRGVAYCATCDGEFFTGMNVFVIGGGFAAVEEGIFLTKYAKHVTIVVLLDHFSCAASVSDKLKENDKITVKYETELKRVEGSSKLEKAVFFNKITGQEEEYLASENGDFGIFVFAGYTPNTGWLPSTIELNEQGYIITDRNQRTNLPGVYAAGDVCVKNLRQVVTAVADGAVAATSLEKDVAELHKELDIPEFEVKLPKKAITTNRAGSDSADTMSGNKEIDTSGFLDEATKEQLKALFEKFNRNVSVEASIGNDNLSKEIEAFLNEFTALTDKVSWFKKEQADLSYQPGMEIIKEDGTRTGMIFHGVPGGHEINSFVVALYNAAGPGTVIGEEEQNRILQINKAINYKILVSLSCTMCPEVVMATQKIAALSQHVTAEMYDIAHFPELKEKYKVMSVPCLVINDEMVTFGKKGIKEILEFSK